MALGPNGRTAYRLTETLGAGGTYYWRVRAPRRRQHRPLLRAEQLHADRAGRHRPADADRTARPDRHHRAGLQGAERPHLRAGRPGDLSDRGRRGPGPGRHRRRPQHRGRLGRDHLGVRRQRPLRHHPLLACLCHQRCGPELRTRRGRRSARPTRLPPAVGVAVVAAEAAAGAAAAPSAPPARSTSTKRWRSSAPSTTGPAPTWAAARRATAVTRSSPAPWRPSTTATRASTRRARTRTGASRTAAPGGRSPTT